MISGLTEHCIPTQQHQLVHLWSLRNELNIAAFVGFCLRLDDVLHCLVEVHLLCYQCLPEVGAVLKVLDPSAAIQFNDTVHLLKLGDCDATLFRLGNPRDLHLVCWVCLAQRAGAIDQLLHAGLSHSLLPRGHASPVSPRHHATCAGYPLANGASRGAFGHHDLRCRPPWTHLGLLLFRVFDNGSLRADGRALGFFAC